MKRRMLWLVALVVIALVVVHVANHARTSFGALEDGAEALLERTREVREGARPTYQTEMAARLADLGGTVRLDESVRSARAVTDASQDDATVDAIVFALDFEGEDATELVVKEDGAGAFEVADGVARLETRGQLVESADALDIPVDDVADIVIRVRAEQPALLTLGWQGPSSKRRLMGDRIAIDLLGDPEFQTYVVNGKVALKRGLSPGESIRRLGIQVTPSDGRVVEIDFVRFVSKLAKYETAPHGRDYETLGNELRPVLYMLPGRTLEYGVTVPENDPRLEFGLGILQDGPVDFRIDVRKNGSDDDPAALFAERRDDANRWSDHVVDLSAYAGERVDLRLTVAADDANVGFFSSPTVRGAREEPRHIILIVEDTVRADRLSLYGWDRENSAARKRIADRGHVFENAVAQATKTRPSIASMLTSLLPSATGVWGFADALDENFLTLPEMLRSYGYVTASFVQNGNAGPYAGMHQGFDFLYDAETVGQATETILDVHAPDWIERNADRNLFVYVHILDPHGPYDPPPPFDERYHGSPRGATPVEHAGHMDPSWEEAPTAEGRRMLYESEIEHNDAVLDRFFDRLEAAGVLDNAAVMMVSDHGEYLGDFGEWEHHPPGLRPVAHIPMILSDPKNLPEGVRHEEHVQLLDVAPTLLELAGIDPSELLLQGDSLVPLATGEDEGRFAERLVVAEEPMAMTRLDPCDCGSLYFGDWHFIVSRKLGSGRLPLAWRMRAYEIDEEAREGSPSLGFLPDFRIRYAVTGILGDLQREGVAASEAFMESERAAVRYDPDTLERLRSLGYVGE